MNEVDLRKTTEHGGDGSTLYTAQVTTLEDYHLALTGLTLADEQQAQALADVDASVAAEGQQVQRQLAELDAAATDLERRAHALAVQDVPGLHDWWSTQLRAVARRDEPRDRVSDLRMAGAALEAAHAEFGARRAHALDVEEVRRGWRLDWWRLAALGVVLLVLVLPGAIAQANFTSAVIGGTFLSLIFALVARRGPSRMLPAVSGAFRLGAPGHGKASVVLVQTGCMLVYGVVPRPEDSWVVQASEFGSAGHELSTFAFRAGLLLGTGVAIALAVTIRAAWKRQTAR